MSRIENLLKFLSEQYPDDWWLSALTIIKDNEEDIFLDQLRIYSRALEVLDNKSWKVIREKATTSFKQNIHRRGKQPFFNLLNEVLAYEYLTELNRECVSLLREHGKCKVPDIKFNANGKELYCEVKTMGVSDEELDRADKEECYDNSVYSELGEGFFRKLSDTINRAISQLYSDDPENIIYIILNFDDFVGFYHETYKQQLKSFLETEYPSNQVYIRVGLFKRFIQHHVPESA